MGDYACVNSLLGLSTDGASLGRGRFGGMGNGRLSFGATFGYGIPVVPEVPMPIVVQARPFLIPRVYCQWDMGTLLEAAQRSRVVSVLFEV